MPHRLSTIEARRCGPVDNDEQEVVESKTRCGASASWMRGRVEDM